MEIILFIAVITGIGLYFYLKHEDKKIIAASPEHAFKVNVSIQPITDNIPKFMRHGKTLTHSVTVDVQISPKDWQRIKDAGMYDWVLFQYPSPQGDDEPRYYKVRDLEYKGGAPFYDLVTAEDAKEQLIRNLFVLRDNIELHKSGKREEQLEI